jgi:hypothetical protein
MVGKGSSEIHQYLVRYLDSGLTLCNVVQRLHNLDIGSKYRAKEILKLNTSCTQELIEVTNGLLIYSKVGRSHLAQSSIDTF